MSQLIEIPERSPILLIENVWEFRTWNDPGRHAKWLQAGGDKRDRFLDGLDVAVNKNHILDDGAAELWTLFAALAGGTAFSSSNASIGIGDDSTPVADDQTGLIATVNVYYKAIDGAPTLDQNGRRINYVATVPDGQAEFEWEEFVLANSADGSDIQLNRIAQSQGEKLEGQVRAITLRMTIPTLA